jgi:hypothetical protein
MTKTEQVTLLKTFFDLQTLPKTFDLGPGEKIVDLKKFIDSHFTTLNSDCASVIQIAYLDRLIKLQSRMAEQR